MISASVLPFCLGKVVRVVKCTISKDINRGKSTPSKILPLRTFLLKLSISTGRSISLSCPSSKKWFSPGGRSVSVSDRSDMMLWVIHLGSEASFYRRNPIDLRMNIQTKEGFDVLKGLCDPSIDLSLGCLDKGFPDLSHTSGRESLSSKKGLEI